MPAPSRRKPSDIARRTAEKNAEQHAPSTEIDSGVQKSAALISACVLLSRITGFFRTWTMAFAMGSTLLASSYQVANNLPTMLYDMVIGGMLVTAFLPVYVSAKKRLGNEGGNEYASNLLTLTILFVGAVSIICSICAPQLIYTQSFLSDQSTMQTSVFFFRFFAFQILLYAAGSIVSGLLNAHRDFLWSSIAPVFNNIIVIITFVAYAIVAPSNPDLALWIIAIGNPLGVAVQLAIQLPALARNGIHIRPRINLHDPALKETLSIGIPAVIVMVTSFMVVSVQNAAAYGVADNGPSIISYARLWFTLPYAFLAVPITTTMFTELSELFANDNRKGFQSAVIAGCKQILFLTIPFALFLMVFAYPLVNLYHAGAFTADHVDGVATYLIAVAVSLPFYGVNTYLQKTFSAMRALKRYAVYNVICTALQIAFTLIIATNPALDWHLRMAVIAFGDTLFFATSDIMCALYLRKRFHGAGANSNRRPRAKRASGVNDEANMGIAAIVKSSLNGLVCGAAGALVGLLLLNALNALMPFAGSIALSFIYVVVAGIAAVAVSFGIAWVRHIDDAEPIFNIINSISVRLIRKK